MTQLLEVELAFKKLLIPPSYSDTLEDSYIYARTNV